MLQSAGTAKRFALFDYGFRGLFLLAGTYAIVAILSANATCSTTAQ